MLSTAVSTVSRVCNLVGLVSYALNIFWEKLEKLKFNSVCRFPVIRFAVHHNLVGN